MKFSKWDYVGILIGGVSFYVGTLVFGTGDGPMAAGWMLGGWSTRFIVGRMYK